MKQIESGFSVLEVVIVLAIFLIVAALGVPSMRQVMDNYRLTTSGRDLANMLQQTRMLAVQNNQPYYPQVSGGKLASSQSATQLAGGPAPASNPTVVTSGSVTFQATGPGTTTTLDNFVGGGTPVIGSAIGAASVIQVGFNARGIPCQQNGGNPFSCTPLASGVEWFMQSSASKGWEAVTVTPAGRIKSWRGTSSGMWK